MADWSPYADEVANENDVYPARCRRCGNTTSWSMARHYEGERREQCFWECGTCGHQVFMVRASVIRKARQAAAERDHR